MMRVFDRAGRVTTVRAALRAALQAAEFPTDVYEPAPEFTEPARMTAWLSAHGPTDVVKVEITSRGRLMTDHDPWRDAMLEWADARLPVRDPFLDPK